jgi:hypothetical protein
MLLTFATNIFAFREQVICQVGLSNISERPTLVAPSYYNESLFFYITNANGVRLPPIDEHYFWAGARGPREIVPAHGTERLFHPISLSGYYDFPPGTYRIFAVREFRDFSITSQVTTIVIKEAQLLHATNTPYFSPK